MLLHNINSSKWSNAFWKNRTPIKPASCISIILKAKTKTYTILLLLLLLLRICTIYDVYYIVRMIYPWCTIVTLMFSSKKYNLSRPPENNAKTTWSDGLFLLYFCQEAISHCGWSLVKWIYSEKSDSETEVVTTTTTLLVCWKIGHWNWESEARIVVTEKGTFASQILKGNTIYAMRRDSAIDYCTTSMYTTYNYTNKLADQTAQTLLVMTVATVRSIRRTTTIIVPLLQ